MPADQPIAETFQFCPRCGQRAERRGVNPFRCAACEFTLYFSPITAVGAIVTDAGDQVLLIRRAKDPGRGKFGLPGGFVDRGETAEEALIREVREEINLTVLRMSYLVSFPNRYVYRGVAIPVTDLFYVCEVDSFDTLACQEDEISQWHFCHPTAAELDQMAFASNRRALERYLETVE